MKKMISIFLLFLVVGCEGKPPLACPADAKVCPDGSTVSRTGPDCVFPQCPVNKESMSVSTPKKVYHSREKMWVNVSFNSPKSGNTSFTVYGIHSRGQNRLLLRSIKSVNVGENTLVFDYQTPPCTGCAGINPGDYYVHVNATVDGQLFYANTTVEVRQ